MFSMQCSSDTSLNADIEVLKEICGIYFPIEEINFDSNEEFDHLVNGSDMKDDKKFLV